MNTAVWPLVASNDDGIRPAGPSNACFYCGRRVGEPHDRICVVVQKRVRLRVTATVDGEELTATWDLDEVHSWTPEQIEFRYNSSSWCQSNLFAYEDNDDFKWDKDPSVAWSKLKLVNKECLCGVLKFKFDRVLDYTPRRLLRDEGN